MDTQSQFGIERGKIDKDVAKYWKENYDLSYIMKRDWDKIGKDLEGKIHIYCGDMDNYYPKQCCRPNRGIP